MDSTDPAAVTLADVEAAQARMQGALVRTPTLRSATLSALTGADVWLKFENHQFTASFKERGALNCLLGLDPEARARGVIAASAGNHAQAVAHHARRLGIPATIVMPRTTPNAKVEATRVFGPELVLHGALFDEAAAHAAALAVARGLTMVHPYDDPAVIAGQGTVALELLDDAPAPEVLLVPVGGGGLIAGVATVMAARVADCEVIGVQSDRFAGVVHALNRPAPAFGTSTIAEGIAVRQPGARTVPVIARHVADLVLVGEADIERAVQLLLEIEKTVVEGAGAAGLAALLADPARFRGRRVALVLSGGNIDLMILQSVILRGLVRTRRLVRLQVELPDVPGALARICTRLGELDSNIIDIEHQRTFSGSSVRASVVEFVLQMRGAEQVGQVLAALAADGHAVRLVTDD